MFNNLRQMTRTTNTLILLVVLLYNSVNGASIPEHVLKDPSFVQCLNQHSTSDPADYVNVVATCYGFVGRPRFGKRYDPLVRRISVPNYVVDYDWS